VRKRFGTVAGERVEPEPEYTGVIAAGYKSHHLKHRPEPAEPAAPGLLSIEHGPMPDGVGFRGGMFQMTIHEGNRDAVEAYFENLLGPAPRNEPWVITQEMQTAKPLACGHHQCDGCTCPR
jgi:hypothetical protein